MKKLSKSPKTLEEAIEIIEQLCLIITDLKKENAELKERLNINSKNSSIPPSQDRSKKKHQKNLLGVSVAGSQGIKEVTGNYCQNLKLIK